MLPVAADGLELHEPGIVSRYEEFVSIKHTIAIRTGEHRLVIDLLALVLPQQRTIARIQRLDEITCLRQKHDAVVDERCRLL